MVNKFSELMHTISLWVMFFLFYGFVSIAMAAPIELNGRCLATDIQAIEEWESRLPVTDLTGKNIQITVGAWTASTAGGSLTVPYTSKVGAGTATAQTAVFPPCDAGVVGETADADLWNKVSSNALIYYGILVVLFFIGLRMGFLL